MKDLDFVRKPEASRNTINKWVKVRTSDKIKGLVPEGLIATDTGIIITNAIYFNGKWIYELIRK